jgi:alpha-N-arabinofuranosidase
MVWKLLRILSFLLPVLVFAPFVHANPRFHVDTTRDAGPVRRYLFGANVEYVGEDTPAARAVMDGTTIARFPGGDDVSRFLWSDPSIGTCTNSRWNWDAIASYAREHGMAFFLESNVVLGDAESTAQWVADAKARGIAVPYLDVGNEVWGSWDAGYRTPAQYEQDVRATAAAVRAVSPETKIVLEVGTFNEDSWNRDAVRRLADVVDAIDYHYYPNHRSDAEAMSVTAGADGVKPLVNRLRAMLRDVAPARADALEILIGEYDGVSDPVRGEPPVPGHVYLQWAMPNALFYGVALGEMMEAGVAAATFYELQGYRFGAIDGGACTPGNNAIRRPKELVLRLWREHFGDRLLGVDALEVPTFHSDGPTNWDGFAGDAPFVRAYASLGDDGESLRLMITNRHPDEAFETEWSIDGFEPEASAETWQVAGDSMLATNENVGGPVDAVHTVTGSAPIAGRSFVFRAPPHSVTARVIRRRGATNRGESIEAAPTARSVTARVDAGAAVTDTDARDAGANSVSRATASCSAAQPGSGDAVALPLAMGAIVGLVAVVKRARKRRRE